MALSTYSQLIESMSAWLDGSDLGGREADLIALCEDELNARLASALQQGAFIRPMAERSALTIDAEYVDLPDAMAPDGTMSADKVVDDMTAANTHTLYRTASVVSGTTYCLSFYVRSGGHTQCRLTNGGGNIPIVSTYFDLDAGAIISGTGSIVATGNGWYRISATMTATATGIETFYLQAAAGGSGVYDGDGTSGIYVWGGQVEAGTFLTSYIPTGSVSAARSVESSNVKDHFFLSFYNPVESTVVVDFDILGLSTTAGGVPVGFDSGSANGFTIYKGVGSLAMFVFGGDAGVQTGNITLRTPCRAAMCFNRAQVVGLLNGTSAVTVIPLSPSIPDRMWIGRNWSGHHLNGHIRSLSYFNRRLSSVDLQQLTAS